MLRGQLQVITWAPGDHSFGLAVYHEMQPVSVFAALSGFAAHPKLWTPEEIAFQLCAEAHVTYVYLQWCRCRALTCKALTGHRTCRNGILRFHQPCLILGPLPLLPLSYCHMLERQQASYICSAAA